ncbi:MAG: hypothetical protein U0790_10750 [Isosphaeraceae bacterium]
MQPGQYYLNYELDPALPFVMVGAMNNNLRVEPGAEAEAPSIAARARHRDHRPGDRRRDGQGRRGSP